MTPICKVIGCASQRIHSRGLCKECYNSAVRYVKKGMTSWEKLQEDGKVLPPDQKGKRGNVNRRLYLKRKLYFLGDESGKV